MSFSLPPPKIKIKTVTTAQLPLHSKSQDRKMGSREGEKWEKEEEKKQSEGESWEKLIERFRRESD